MIPGSGRAGQTGASPHQPASHRAARPAPTSPLPSCKMCLSAPRGPGTPGSHRMCWSGPHSPSLGTVGPCEVMGRRGLLVVAQPSMGWPRQPPHPRVRVGGNPGRACNSIPSPTLSNPQRPALQIPAPPLTLLAEAKVCDLDIALGVQEQIVQLQVPVMGWGDVKRDEAGESGPCLKPEGP